MDFRFFKRAALIAFAVVGPVLATPERTMAAEPSMTAKQFEADFHQKIHSGQTREDVERLLRGLPMSFGYIDRKDFWKDSVANDLAPKDVAGAIVGSTRTLEHSFLFDTFVQIAVYFDKNGKVVIAKSQTLSAGP